MHVGMLPAGCLLDGSFSSRFAGPSVKGWNGQISGHGSEVRQLSRKEIRGRIEQGKMQTNKTGDKVSENSHRVSCNLAVE
jgi:hypothetical protein